MTQGAIWLHRQLLDCPELKEPTALALWVHLLLRASHKPGRLNFRKQIFPVRRGQMVTSLRQLVDETGIPMRPLRRILGIFEKSKMLKTDTVGGTAATLVTICKYDDFQSGALIGGTANGTEAAQKRHTEQEEKDSPTPNVESDSNPNPNTASATPTRRIRKEYSAEFEQLWTTYPRRDEDEKGECWKAWLTVARDYDAPAILRSAHEWHIAQRDNEYRIGLRRWLKTKRFLTPPPAYRPNGTGQVTFGTIMANQTPDYTNGTDDFGSVLEGTCADEPYEAAEHGSISLPVRAGHAPDAGGLHGRVATLPGAGSSRWLPSVGTAEGDVAGSVRAGRLH